jgi:hypothetical protein
MKWGLDTVNSLIGVLSIAGRYCWWTAIHSSRLWKAYISPFSIYFISIQSFNHIFLHFRSAHVHSHPKTIAKFFKRSNTCPKSWYGQCSKTAILNWAVVEPRFCLESACPPIWHWSEKNDAGQELVLRLFTPYLVTYQQRKSTSSLV